jgi:putative redox protein
VDSMEIRVRGTRTEDHPRVYTGIELEYVVTGTNLSEAAVARSIDLSINKYCSVGAMLAPSVPIKTSFRIITGKEKTA